MATASSAPYASLDGVSPSGRLAGRVVPVTWKDRTVHFQVHRPSDYTMKQHLAGQFAGASALGLLVGRVEPGSRVLDVGAGFGNSTIFAATVLRASEVVPIEPHLEAAEVLRANVELNGLANTDLSLLGIAFGEVEGRGCVVVPYQTHLGGAQVVKEEAGPVAICRGDEVLAGLDFDLVVIDVNGRETEVLAGLATSIERCRPLILAASTPRTRDLLAGFLGRRGYRIGPSVDLHSGKQSFVLFEPPARKVLPPAHGKHAQGTISSWKQQEVSFRFFVANPHDSIQSCHISGRLYEEEELSLMARHVRPGARILDCGANVGNHAVAFVRLLGAARVVAIEPNPTAIEILRINRALNEAHNIDLSYVGVALGEREGLCSMAPEPVDNLGGTFIEMTDKGAIRCACGDDLLANEHFDFIKIDVEGKELAVLEGLRSVITRDRPVLFVEVNEKNTEAFSVFLEGHAYAVVEKYQRYRRLINLLAIPNDLSRSQRRANSGMDSTCDLDSNAHTCDREISDVDRPN